jgi:hypothetical protein
MVNNKNEVGFNWLNIKVEFVYIHKPFLLEKIKTYIYLISVKKRVLVIDENSEFVKSIDLNCIRK